MLARPDVPWLVPAAAQGVDAHAELLVGGVDEAVRIDHQADVAGPVAHHHDAHRVEEDEIAGRGGGRGRGGGLPAARPRQPRHLAPQTLNW